MKKIIEIVLEEPGGPWISLFLSFFKINSKIGVVTILLGKNVNLFYFC